MPQIHRCQPGECLVRVAWNYLLDSKVVSNHPDNRDLLAKRKDPDMLFPSDKVTIPDGKQPTYMLATANDIASSSRFRAKSFDWWSGTRSTSL